jgi:hypothetical protein
LSNPAANASGGTIGVGEADIGAAEDARGAAGASERWGLSVATGCCGAGAVVTWEDMCGTDTTGGGDTIVASDRGAAGVGCRAKGAVALA